jgi:hypothetical protein
LQAALRTKGILPGVALVVLAAAVPGAAASGGEHFGLKIVSTNGFYVDNDPAGPSGGDLFGAEGYLRRGGERVGRSTSACTASSATGAECNATLQIHGRGQIQLSGIIHNQEAENRLSITGGSGDFRDVAGRANLHRLSQDGSKQRVDLTVVR